MRMRFEWHPGKAKANLWKHGVSFREAATVFGDPLSWTFSDPDHSREEDRLITVGISQLGNLLVIAHTDREGAIRIINARRATRREGRYYEQKKK